MLCVSGDKEQAPPAPKEKGETLPHLNNLLEEKCIIQVILWKKMKNFEAYERFV